MPGRSTAGFHQPGRHCLHQARSAVRCLASRMKGEPHPTKNRLWAGLSCICKAASNELNCFPAWPLPEMVMRRAGRECVYGNAKGRTQSHTVRCHSTTVPQYDQRKYLDRLRLRAGGGSAGRKKKARKTIVLFYKWVARWPRPARQWGIDKMKNKTPQENDRLCDKWAARVPYEPGTERGCGEDEIRKNSPKPGPKAQKTCPVPQ